MDNSQDKGKPAKLRFRSSTDKNTGLLTREMLVRIQPEVPN